MPDEPVDQLPSVSALEGLDDWRTVLRTAQATFLAPSFPAAGRLVAAIADAAEAADHHPDVSLSYPGRVRVARHAPMPSTASRRHDVDLARHISRLAADAGATAEPLAAQVVEIAIDAMDVERIRPFWAAVLDYREQSDGEPRRPSGLSAPRSGSSRWTSRRTERNRFHLDVSRPARRRRAAPRSRARRRAARSSPTGTPGRSAVLADAEGNAGLHLHLAGPHPA